MKEIYEKLISQLPPLIDITETFCPEDVFDDNERANLVESCATLITDYIEENPLVFSKPDYANIIREEVIELMEQTIIPCTSVIETEELSLIYQMASYIVFSTIAPRRSYKNTFVRKLKPNIQVIKEKLENIRNRPQSEQCTPQWYIDRWNRLSGSNAWKAFGTKAQVNSLILEKCKPIDVNKYRNVNIDSPLHHGKRFEPVSTQYYEYIYGAKVDEFGCVPHSEHNFLGASPDGIVVNEDCPRFGRMLEIKNVTTRKINGVPKEDYWIQMQIQMEVCNLNECDFLETEIYSYPSYDDFVADGSFQKSANNKYKGVISQYIIDGQPYYEYAPFQCNQEEFDKWEEEICEKHSEHTWITNIYYRIDKISCVLVLRNKKWMKSAINVLRDVWEQIIYDRENGYEHRQPKSRQTIPNKSKPSNCVINVTKLLDNDTNDANDTNDTSNTNTVETTETTETTTNTKTAKTTKMRVWDAFPPKTTKIKTTNKQIPKKRKTSEIQPTLVVDI